jgi:hypothetical protein
MIRLFNLDLHISVIADVKEILERLFPGELQIDAWSISGHTWVFGRPPEPVQIIHAHSWKYMNQAMIDAFVNYYREHLSKYDGFVITHTPVFCRLFESFGKPIIMVNSCRYDQPYCMPGHGNPSERATLNACLKRLHAAGRLIPVSNNLADRDYLQLGTGIPSVHLPSLCLYTGIRHDPTKAAQRPATIACTHLDCIPAWIPVAPKPSSPYSWEDLLNRRALVCIPYEASTMSLFEEYSSGVPLLIPSKPFYKSLILSGKAVMASYNSPNYRMDFPETQSLDWWLDRCDFYDTENMPGIYYFNSWEELHELLQRDAFEPMEEHVEIRRQREERIESQWKRLIQENFFGVNRNERVAE